MKSTMNLFQGEAFETSMTLSPQNNSIDDRCNGDRPDCTVRSSDPPKRYTQEYFENRIATLCKKFQDALPLKEYLDVFHAFSSILQSLESAKQSLDAATKVLQDLQKAQADGTAIDPKLIESAQEAVQRAQDTVTNVRGAGTDAGCAVVSANHLDHLSILVDEAELLECAVLVQGTPHGLAEWCQAGGTIYPNDSDDDDYGDSHDTGTQTMNPNEMLLDAFLNDLEFMKQVLIANGPSKGYYGPMLEIHFRLRKEMDSGGGAANQGESQYDNLELQERLALAVALEHANPIAVFQTNGTFVDPVARFWHYVRAHQNGELDEAFATMSTWELRLVVDCNATNEDLQWGRDYLKAYRPDQIWAPEDDRFQYIWSVRTDLGYRQPDHDYANYVDLISAGGECGARAWFARFICKAFGIPTWGVRQPGHAAVSRWLRTPAGGTRGCGEGSRVKWETCLGVGWDLSTWDENRYTGSDRNGPRHGLDFFEETQARNAVAASCGCNSYYHMVTLLECLAESFGETVEEDFSSQKIWRSLSIAQRKMLATSQPIVDLDPHEENDDEMTNVRVGECFERSLNKMTNDCNCCTQTDVSCVVIHATSFVDPPQPTKTVMPMNSFYGGTQLHLEKDGAVMYEIPATLEAGEYALSCMLVNIHRFQPPLLVTVESESCSTCLLDDDEFEMISSQPTVLAVQYTRGRWQRTESIRITLKPGDRLTLTRDPKPPACWGLTIKELFLEPIHSI